MYQIPAPIKSAILFMHSHGTTDPVLPEIDAPMLVCAGADETRRSVAAVRHVAEFVPDVTFKRFENSGHFPPFRGARAVQSGDEPVH